MTDPTTDAPDGPTDRPIPRWSTVLGRTARAIRRRDWGMVAIEVTVVVLGVVIGFQVTAWGQERTDRATEQSYLLQLREDLLQTEREIARIDSLALVHDRGGWRLVQAYHAQAPPPPDSVLLWLATIDRIMGSARPVTSTAFALVSTGDLTLIRDDSLRAAITAYLEDTESELVWYRQAVASWVNAADRLGRLYTWYAWIPIDAPQALVDSVARVQPYFRYPVGPRRPIPLPDAQRVVRDDTTFNALSEMNTAKSNLHATRRDMIEDAERLRAAIEREL